MFDNTIARYDSASSESNFKLVHVQSSTQLAGFDPQTS